MRAKKGRGLSGKAPRRPGRWLRTTTRARPGQRTYELMTVMALALLVLGAVAGFAFALDRQIRGGLLDQRAEAMRRPDWVSLDALPEYVPRTFAAVVDPTLLEEGAVRPREEGAAMARELARQIHLLPNSLSGRARELVMGPVLERHLSADQLLELFLNRVYLGRAQGFPVYGVYHAAREYFDKEPQELTLGETATLAGLLLQPRFDDPDAQPGAVGVRRNEVLRVLLVGELISQGQYRTAIAERLPFQPGVEEQPMTRRLELAADTGVIRLPPELLPRPDSAAGAE